MTENYETIEAAFTHRISDFTLDVNLSLPSRGVTVLFGPSGSGKTTLLRCLAGLEEAQHGELSWGDEVWQSGASFVPTHRRPIGYVFQEASLLPILALRGICTMRLNVRVQADLMTLRSSKC